MNNSLVKKVLPHLIAVVVFIVVAALFCKPVLDGNVLNQHDTIGWKGMAQNSFEYKERTGHFPLWNPNLFSGMPNYQVAMEGKTVLPDMVKIFGLGLPKPMNFFFMASLCFYILCMVFKVNPLVGMISALAYAYSTYNPGLIAAGHETQMMATAFAPLLIAGLISIYEKNYWLGLALATLGANIQIGVNHLQVTYYVFIIILFISAGYLIKWIKEKDWRHIGIVAPLVAVSAIIGVAANSLILKTTSEYAKYTMRGGKNVSIEGDTVKNVNTTGLDKSYAFEYSLSKPEVTTLLMPGGMGGDSKQKLSEESAVSKKLIKKGINEASAQELSANMPKYWGGLPYTAGPAYLGVIICIIGLLGFVLVKSHLRWSLLTATVLGVLLSWGKNFAGFNYFFFDNVPLYNKFRAPSFAQFIPQFCVGVIAALSLQKLIFEEKSREFINANLKKILYAAGGLFALLGLMYLSMGYSSSIDKEIIEGYTDPQTKSSDIGRLIVSGLKTERRELFGIGILRTLGFALLVIGCLWAYAKNKLSRTVVSIMLLVMSTLEITVVSKKYLSEDAYVSPDEYVSSNFAPNAIENEILQDKDPNFRVLNLVGTPSGGTFSESRTSYFFKSVGGYHPAKLRIYQDIIELYLSSRPNPQVLNMLNTRYIIVPDQQNNRPAIIKNPDVYGNCWLVSKVIFAEDQAAMLNQLGRINLKDTAILLKSDAAAIGQPTRDSSSSVKMMKFDNDVIEYEANCNGPQFAVFSEIYYPKGWNAYVDGKLTPYYNTNYILRGLQLPSGKHTIRFVFEPESVSKGKKMMFLASILTAIAFLGGLFMHFWKASKKNS